jgi:hypothetical protein
VPSAASPPTTESQLVSLDVALLLGRRLALEWEHVNGCFNAEEHLDPDMPLAMANTIEGLLKLYDMLLGSTDSQHQSQVVGHSGNPSPPPLTEQIHPPSRSQVVMVPTTLGGLRLGGEEPHIVAHEALRHMIARLDDILKDVEEEGTQTMSGTEATKIALLRDVKRAQELMFRLLGRVPG